MCILCLSDFSEAVGLAAVILERQLAFGRLLNKAARQCYRWTESGSDKIKYVPLSVADDAQIFIPAALSTSKSGVHAVLFRLHSGRRAVSLRIGGVCHRDVLITLICRQTDHYSGERGLGASNGHRTSCVGRNRSRVATSQTITIGQDNPTTQMSITCLQCAVEFKTRGP